MPARQSLTTTLMVRYAAALVAVVGVFVLQSPAGASPPQVVLAPSIDAVDAEHAAVDVSRVVVGQRDTQLRVEIRSEKGWAAPELPPGGLCVHLIEPLCFGARGDQLVLERRGTAIQATVVRPDKKTIIATFPPRAAGIAPGRLVSWYVTSGPAAADCSVGCSDRVPDSGTHTFRARVLAQERCFGAAARDAHKPCVNPNLSRTVIPSPGGAPLDSGTWCTADGEPRVGRPCWFGDQRAQAPAKVLLVGDSHAAHWSEAVDVLAESRGWRAAIIARPGCAFSTEVAAGTPAGTCRTQNAAAVDFLRKHPSVRYVVTSTSAGRGLSAGGFRTQWARMPSTVRKLYVIRDIPRMQLGTADCLRRVLAHRGRSSGACGLARAGAFKADGAFAAARGRSQTRAVDLTNRFCNRTTCFPVTGGANAYRDDNHMTNTFSRTLGPFLDAALGF